MNSFSLSQPILKPAMSWLERAQCAKFGGPPKGAANVEERESSISSIPKGCLCSGLFSMRKIRRAISATATRSRFRPLCACC